MFYLFYILGHCIDPFQPAHSTQQNLLLPGARPMAFNPITLEEQVLQPPWDHAHDIWFECDTQNGYFGDGGQMTCGKDGRWTVVTGAQCQLRGKDTVSLMHISPVPRRLKVKVTHNFDQEILV